MIRRVLATKMLGCIDEEEEEMGDSRERVDGISGEKRQITALFVVEEKKEKKGDPKNE